MNIQHYFRYLVLTLLLIMTTGCISTSVKDFTDPDYITFTSKKLLLDATNPLFDEAFKNKLKNIDIEYLSTNSLFLPTRKYTSEDKVKIIKEKGFDSYLVINIESDDSSSRVVAYQTSSTANAYSSGYGNAYATGSSSTVPITSHRRQTGATAKLYDVKTGRMAWTADINTSASGALYMSNSGTVYSMVKKIIASLLAKGHLKNKPRS